MLKRFSLDNLNLSILLTVCVLTVCGLVAIYSATYSVEAANAHEKFNKQMAWFAISLVTLFFVAYVPVKMFYKQAYTIYAVCLFLLILVLLIGKGAGTRRWITLGPVWLQPAEFAKVGALLALAKYLSRDTRNLNNLKEIVIALLIILIPFVLVMRQPDLGSALVFLALLLPVLHWAGLSATVLFVFLAPVISLFCAFNYYSFLAAMIVICVVLVFFHRGLTFFLVNFIINIGVGIVTPIMWDLLKEYQKNRILTFLGFVQDPHGLGYQVIQSKVAIGSGGFSGKGFLEGTQTHLRFLPEQHTDFVFSVIGEEFGFIGAIILLGLFFFLVTKTIDIAGNVKSMFLSIVTFGAAIIFIFQIFVNIGMTIGIMPVTGLPLPFLSYGGSSLLANFVLTGLILNTARKRFEYL